MTYWGVDPAKPGADRTVEVPVEPGEGQAKLLDRAYYNGARQAASMAHQSLRAMDDWIAGGCGGRGPVTKESSHEG